MILKIIAVAGIIAVILFVGQWLINRYSHDNEQLRKLVHVLFGTGLAALSLLIPLNFVAVIALFMFLSMFVSRYLFEHFDNPWIRYFGKVYNVGRITYGEFFYPLSAIALVFLADSKWEFAASMLILGIADSVAALVGKKYGKSNTYLVFGQKKSIAGSAAFFVATLLIVWGFTAFSGAEVSGTSVGLILLTTMLITVAENLGVYGSDNLLIPLLAVVLLNRL